MFLAYYNFVWRTRDVEEGRAQLPAAMAAGVVDRLMSFEDLFDAVMGEGYAMAAQQSDQQRAWPGLRSLPSSFRVEAF